MNSLGCIWHPEKHAMWEALSGTSWYAGIWHPMVQTPTSRLRDSLHLHIKLRNSRKERSQKYIIETWAVGKSQHFHADICPTSSTQHQYPSIIYGDEIVKVYCNTALESTVTSPNASSVLFLVHIQTPAIFGTIQLHHCMNQSHFLSIHIMLPLSLRVVQCQNCHFHLQIIVHLHLHL